MKNYRKQIAGLMAGVGMLIFLSGCVEHRYYRKYHHHSRGYYERRHMPPPPGIDIDIHN